MKLFLIGLFLASGCTTIEPNNKIYCNKLVNCFNDLNTKCHDRGHILNVIDYLGDYGYPNVDHGYEHIPTQQYQMTYECQ